ncbi:hypothetical protein Tco_1041554 [Tanacetum coccineum]|uniref:Uncharacterized protein n=1 Tax=Tanacetum coccineum TaxID=301880 RepID=A0ABQ5GH82_9ASTR
METSKCTSNGTSKSQPKSTGKFAQVEETVVEARDTQGLQNLGEDTGNTDEPPVVNVDPNDWFKKPERPPTPHPERNNGGSTGRTYTTSLTKTKAAKYDLLGIEYMVPNLWSPVKVAYDNHALLGTSHWVTNVKVKEWYDYGHLDEIKVRRSDQQLYKREWKTFIIGVNSLPEEVTSLGTNDAQGGYPDLKPYFAYFNLKASYINGDYTLISLCDTLKDMANNLEMGYTSVMPRRGWSSLDKKRSRIMIKDIDRQLLDRRLMRSLEKFVGGKEYVEDLRLLQRTI